MFRNFATIAIILLFGNAEVARAENVQIDFNRDIRPIFSNHCVGCHGRGQREAGLRLDVQQGAFARLDSGRYAIVPGNVASSEMVRRITAEDAAEQMPPPESGNNLTAREIDLLKKWIEQGASWQGHWAYQTAMRPTLPPVMHAAWPKNEIDYFTLARMERAGLMPSPVADKVQLLRRVTLDLTGLPPTMPEIEAFLADTAPNAYEKVVDRLLASPHFGERMALHWLDLARYADTNGYHADTARQMWRWRDWVIDAFNDNMPFDQFTIEQLAGDLLPDATLSQIIATGFNRNHMINFEDGSIPEEFRTEYVVDRVVTTSTVWLGQTMSCARCHDHKYDPFSSRDFYRLYAYFNNVPERGLDGRDGNSQPFIKAPTRLQQERLDRLQAQITAAEEQLVQRVAEMVPRQIAWEKELLSSEKQSLAPPAGTMIHYRFDEPDGEPVRDAGGNENHAQVIGNPIRIPREIGNALLFDGEVYIETSQPIAFDHAVPFSIALLIYPTTRDRMSLVSCRNEEKQRGIDIQLDDGQVLVRLSHTGPKDSLVVRTKQVIRTNQWQHLTVTYDGSGAAAGIKVFVGIAAQPTTVVDDRLSNSIDANQPLRIGGSDKQPGFRGMIDDVRIYPRKLSDAEAAILAGHNPILEIVRTPRDKRTKNQEEALRQYFLQHNDPTYLRLRAEVEGLRRQHSNLWRDVPTTMVMQELEQPRDTFILRRGDYRHKTERVTPGTPEALPPLPTDAPPNRLGLARWLVDPQNPLTARVTVNRFWQMCFGDGIVRTPEDFGTRGQWPTHPALLDWLATEFIRSGWDVKPMLKLIVMSATYRQSSQVTDETILDRDPENRLLARGPKFQLPAEFIRDKALAAGGLLDRRIGGPSVFPYQPPGLWEEVSFDPELTAQVYQQSHGADLYRRGMYTFWKRAVPPPSMEAFGAADRQVCTVSRSRPQTPFQLLVLLNDPTYVEAARALAQRMMMEGGNSPQERIAYGFRLAVVRKPSPAEANVFVNVFHEQLASFSQNAKNARELLSVGEFARDSNLGEAELAAWTIVAQMILNLNEAVTSG